MDEKGEICSYVQYNYTNSGGRTTPMYFSYGTLKKTTSEEFLLNIIQNILYLVLVAGRRFYATFVLNQIDYLFSKPFCLVLQH